MSIVLPHAANGPYDEITMGGMLRPPENLSDYNTDPGWYQPPPGTLAEVATGEALRANGIARDASSAPRADAAAMKSWQQAAPTQPYAPAGTHDGHSSHQQHQPK